MASHGSRFVFFLLCCLLYCHFITPCCGGRPVSPLLMTHSLKNHVIIAVETGKGVLNNAHNIFNQNPNDSALFFYDKETAEFSLLEGKEQVVSQDTLVHIVGHGGRPAGSPDLGGLFADELADVVSRLSFKEPKIGHISLVACKVHHHEDDQNGFLHSFLRTLVSYYHIETSVSAWTTEVAVDPEGRLLSKINGSKWYMNYPGSLVVAHIVKPNDTESKSSFYAGYKPDPCRFDKGAECCSRGRCNTHIFHESDWIDHVEDEKCDEQTYQNTRETNVESSYSTDNEYTGTTDDHEYSISNGNKHVHYFDTDTDGYDNYSTEGDIDEHISDIDERISDIDERINDIDERINDIDEHINDIDEHISDIDERINDIDEQSDYSSSTDTNEHDLYTDSDNDDDTYTTNNSDHDNNEHIYFTDSDEYSVTDEESNFEWPNSSNLESDDDNIEFVQSDFNDVNSDYNDDRKKYQNKKLTDRVWKR